MRLDEGAVEVGVGGTVSGVVASVELCDVDACGSLLVQLARARIKATPAKVLNRFSYLIETDFLPVPLESVKSQQKMLLCLRK